MSTTADEGLTRSRAAHRRRRAAAGGASPVAADPIEAACAAVATGRPAVVLDGEDGLLHRFGIEIVERIGLTGIAGPLRAAGG